MAEFELSEYQKEILDFFKENPKSNMLINALAGSGKTSTIKMLTEHTTTSDVYLAFNNSISEEFKQKITNPKTKVYTIHALCYLIMNTNLEQQKNSSIKKGFGSSIKGNTNKGAVLDNLKPYKILDQIYVSEYGKYIEFEFRTFLSSNFVALYNLARVTMINLNDESDILKIIRDHNLFADTSENHYNMPPISKIQYILKTLDKKSRQQFEEEKVVDFTDMLYITYLKLLEEEWQVPYWLLFTNIYVDECLPGYIHVPCLIKGNDEFSDIYKTITLENLWKMQERGEKLPLVKSFNLDEDKFEYKQIKNVKKQRIAKTWGIRTESGQVIRSTDKHPFLFHSIETEDTYYRYMKDLIVGDWVYTGEVMENDNLEDEKEMIPVIEKIIEKFPGKVERVYDIEVEDNHSFVAMSDPHDNGFVVHNCQDQNNIQLNLIKFIKRANGRYVLVGDKNQSCYAFTGGNAHAFNLIPKLFAPVAQFDLPICYRCAKTHLKRVNKDFNIPILPRPDAPRGAIKTINKNEIAKYVKPGDMIISRKNKWLGPVIFDLIEKGHSIYIEDKDLLPALKRICNPKKFNGLKELNSYMNKQLKNILKINEKNKSKLNLEVQEENVVVETENPGTNLDNLVFLKTIIAGYMKTHKNNSIEAFQAYLDKVLNTKPSEDAIRLTSVHKAKGLEADNVFVLNEAKICYNPLNPPEQNLQERNLSYISITRAKQNLYLVKEPEE